MAATGSFSNVRRNNFSPGNSDQVGEHEVDLWLIDPGSHLTATSRLEDISALTGHLGTTCPAVKNLDWKAKSNTNSHTLCEEKNAAAEEALRSGAMTDIWKTTISYLEAAGHCLGIDYKERMWNEWVDEITDAVDCLFAVQQDVKLKTAKTDFFDAVSSTSTDDRYSLPPSQAESALPKPKRVSRKSGRRKTGRKPNPCKCFLCAVTLPYKRNLIVHLKTAHGIERSQSLMYKRIKQGDEEMKRLYVAPLKIFRTSRLDK